MFWVPRNTSFWVLRKILFSLNEHQNEKVGPGPQDYNACNQCIEYLCKHRCVFGSFLIVRI